MVGYSNLQGTKKCTVYLQQVLQGKRGTPRAITVLDVGQSDKVVYRGLFMPKNPLEFASSLVKLK